MELTYQLFVGALAGLLAGIVNAGLAPLYRNSRPAGFSSQVATLVIHLIAGLGIALIFWLSWGLVAIVGVSWWLRGVTFALLLWLAVCVPVLITQAQRPGLATLLAAMQWLTTLLCVGLACAWTWNQGP